MHMSHVAQSLDLIVAQSDLVRRCCNASLRSTLVCGSSWPAASHSQAQLQTRRMRSAVSGEGLEVIEMSSTEGH